MKHQLQIQSTWNGDDVFKFIACKLHIAVDRLKLIHKGALLTRDTICTHIKPKALFRAIGEPCEDESGVDVDEIDVIMSKLDVSRDRAVRALKESDDVLDAMLRIGNN